MTKYPVPEGEGLKKRWVCPTKPKKCITLQLSRPAQSGAASVAVQKVSGSERAQGLQNARDKKFLRDRKSWCWREYDMN